MSKVFLGYIRAEHKSSYPIEKMYRVAESLTFADVEVFRRVFEAKELLKKYPLPWVSKINMDRRKIPQSIQAKLMILHYSEEEQVQQSLANLITEGLLVERQMGVGGLSAGGGDTQYSITHFGNYFKKFLLSNG